MGSDFEMKASEKCMKEFFAHKPDDLYCIVLIRSGSLKMNGCTLSLDGIFKETHKKVPCVAAMPGSEVEIKDCAFKGDTTNNADTAGLLAIEANVKVTRSTFAYFKSGALMIIAKPQNEVFLGENTILSCQTCGIYV